MDDMRSIWLLSGCRASEIRRIRSLCTPLDVSAGRTLIRQGRRRTPFIIVGRGTAVVSIDERPVALIEAGSFFGEPTPSESDTAEATVISATPMHLLVFSQQECASLNLHPIRSMQDKIDAVVGERRAVLVERARHPERTSCLDRLRDLPALQQAAL
jgi:hypothetical protein